MITPVRLQDVYSTLQQMLQSPADQVRMSSSLRDMVRNLPPEKGEIFSRQEFERAGTHSYVANFFDVAETGEAPTQVIRIPHDSWIRGVHAFALTALDETQVTAEGLLDAANQRLLVQRTTGTNFRGIIDLNWRLNGSQGFISSGRGELIWRATAMAGDGQYSAALDWRLQQEDTIEVRCRNRIRAIFPAGEDTSLARVIPWVCVIFWAQQLPQPKAV